MKYIILILLFTLALSAATIPVLVNAPPFQCGAIRSGTSNIHAWCWKTYPNLVINMVFTLPMEQAACFEYSPQDVTTEILWKFTLTPTVVKYSVYVNKKITRSGEMEK